MHLGGGQWSGRKQARRYRREDGLDVGALAALALFLAVFRADAFHLGTGMRADGREEGRRLTFAARQTVQALAPRTTWGFGLWEG
jgi:hypothetical protein